MRVRTVRRSRDASAGGASHPATPFAHPAHLAAVLVAAAAVLAAVTFRLYDPDLWQHLLVGRVIDETRAIPRTHLWSWPTYGRLEVPPSWLFRAMLWPLWDAAGVWGVQAWRWLTAFGAFGLAWAAARAGLRRDGRPAGAAFWPIVVAVLCATFYRERSQVRPETLVAVLLGLQLLVLERHRRRPGAALWPLVPIAAIWVNAHLSAPLGLGVTAAYLADDAIAARRGETRGTRALLVVWLLSLAASCLHPAGPRALWEPFAFALRERAEPIFRGIGELQPLELGEHWGDGLAVAMLLWPALLVLRAARGRIEVAGTLICAATTVAALASQRFVGLWAVAAAAGLGRELESASAAIAWPRALASPWLGGALACLMCASLGVRSWKDPARPAGVGIDLVRVPERACDFVAREGIRGRVFQPFHFGGYLLWRFWPERDRLPFMDIHQSGTAQDRRQYVEAFRDGDAWRRLDDTRHFEWVLLDRVQAPGDDLADRLDADSTWALVFADDVAALYVRRAGALAPLAARLAAGIPAGRGAITRWLAAPPADSAEAVRRIAALTRMVGDSPRHRLALALLAAAELQAGRPDDARRHLVEGVAAFPEDSTLRRMLEAFDSGETSGPPR